jgi:glutamate carboxypeptidase
MSLSDRERALCASIAARDAELRATLAEHVAIPTGRSHAPGIAKYGGVIGDRLRALGAVERSAPGTPRPGWLSLPDDVPASVNGADGAEAPAVRIFGHRGDGGPRILIAGHLDTVHDPFGPFDRMTVSADGTTAVGPGVVDMKGGILVAVTALEALHAAGISSAWTFALNADEETGSFTSIDILKDLAREHDIGVAVEPALADGALAVERMGSGQFKIEVFGRSAHVGRSFREGVSAVTALARILLEVDAIADPAGGRIVCAGPLRGGIVTNAVPDYAAAWGNMRFRDGPAGDEIVRRLESFATDSAAMPRVVVHHVRNRPAKPLTPAVAAYAEAVRAAGEDLGQTLPFASTGGVCDGNILQSAGLPTLDTLGVRGGNLHRADEWVDLSSLVERAQLLAVVLCRFATNPPAWSGR